MNSNTLGSVEGVVGSDNLPQSARSHSSLPHISYADRFTLSTDTDSTPQQWARAIFGGTPNRSQRFIWGGLLGLRLVREPSEATIAGWRIGGHGKDWIRLENSSWFMNANLLVQKIDGKVSLATLIQYTHWFARLWWPPLAIIHRFIVPRMLLKAAEKVRARL